MDYERFYGFTREPFSDIPDPSLFYSGPEHTRAFIKILHIAKRNRGLGVLIGDVGTGKTTLSRKILKELQSDSKFEAGLLVLTHSDFTMVWFLKKISALLNIETNSEDKTTLMSLITKKLYEIYETNKRVVLIVDEANKIKSEALLEEIRGLLNLELSTGRLVTFIMSGMPELLTNLKQNESMSQRISTVVKLIPLSAISTKEYIRYRIKSAGINNDIFSDTAYDLIYKFSKGRPRIINVICDNALLEGALMKKKPLDAAVIESVVGEMGIEGG